MAYYQRDIEVIAAPSILGLRPTGVEELAHNLLAAGLETKLGVVHPVNYVPTLNTAYNHQRDAQTKCLNPHLIRDFSLTLGKSVTSSVAANRFPVVLGGDCSILIGIMSALKVRGPHGLIYLDAHADFYQPEQSTTGEVADMNLGIITGRGPSMLTNINNVQPYVPDEHVVHIGQRDEEEAARYGSRDIRQTAIQCFSLAGARKRGVQQTMALALEHAMRLNVAAFWIHFDTDVLSDTINPAVDYRLPGGLLFGEIEQILSTLLTALNIAGITVTIYNPRLDPDGCIAKNITDTIGKAFEGILRL